MPPSDPSGANTCPRSAWNWLIGMVSSPLISIKCKWKRTNCSRAHHLRASTECRMVPYVLQWLFRNSAEQPRFIACGICTTCFRIFSLASSNWWITANTFFVVVVDLVLSPTNCMWKWVIWQIRAKSMCRTHSVCLCLCLCEHISFVWIMEKTHKNLSTQCKYLSWFAVILPFHFREVLAHENLCNFICKANACADDEKSKKNLMWN